MSCGFYLNSRHLTLNCPAYRIRLKLGKILSHFAGGIIGLGTYERRDYGAAV